MYREKGESQGPSESSLFLTVTLSLPLPVTESALFFYRVFSATRTAEIAETDERFFRTVYETFTNRIVYFRTTSTR